jgi:hypothetical protein
MNYKTLAATAEMTMRKSHPTQTELFMNVHLIGKLLLICGVTGLCFPVSSQASITVLRDYDVSDPASWNGSTLSNTSGVGGLDPLTPDDGTPRIQSGPNTVVADYGAPVYVASGGISPVAPPLGATAVNHAYLSFQKYGILFGNDINGSGSQAFNLDSVAPVEGYTLEAFLRLNSGYSAAEATGVGFTAQAAGENQFIRVARDTANTGNTALTSNSQTDNTAGAGGTQNQINSTITSVVPIGQWLHFVKVHDPVAEVVRFYANGILVSTVAFAENGVEYNSNVFATELYGNVGINGREIRGVDYSLFRAYRGTATGSEVQGLFNEVAFVPEPSAMMLLATGALMLWRKRQCEMRIENFGVAPACGDLSARKR